MKVFWPKSGLKNDEGKVVGWRRGDVIVAVAIVERWLDEITTRLSTDKKTKPEDLEVVGISRKVLDARNAVLQFEVRDGLPTRCNKSVQIILFDPPDTRRLRYLCLDSPITIEHECNAGSEELAKQDVYSPRPKLDDRLGDIIPLLNHVKDAQQSINPTTTLSWFLKHSHLAQISQNHLWTATKLSLLPIRLCLIGLETLLASDLRILKFNLGSLATNSSSFAQLGLRLGQLLSTPSAFKRTLSSPEIELVQRSEEYMIFWNTIWLILNDLILGYCARQILDHFALVCSHFIPDLFEQYLVKNIIVALQWLNDWPVGLKLNTPLSAFFCTSFGIICQQWGNLLLPLIQLHSPTFIRLLSFASLGGMTLTCSILRDVVSALSLHLHLCHKITLSLVKWQLESLSGLWNLFRGKRWNVLRQRTDSYAYDVDQLFLGTLLFTVSAFLFPTVLTYAALYASTRASLLVVDRILAGIVTALNAFPLFEVLLRIKEPSRLPAGISFQLRKSRVNKLEVQEGTGVITHVLELKTAPRSLISILTRKS